MESEITGLLVLAFLKVSIHIFFERLPQLLLDDNGTAGMLLNSSCLGVTPLPQHILFYGVSTSISPKSSL